MLTTVGSQRSLESFCLSLHAYHVTWLLIAGDKYDTLEPQTTLTTKIMPDRPSGEVFCKDVLLNLLTSWLISANIFAAVLVVLLIT